MKVKALHNVKIGNTWYKAGDEFETNLTCIIGDSVVLVDEAETPAPVPEKAEEPAIEAAAEPAKEPVKRGRKKA